MERFLTGGWELIRPRWGGTAALARGATLTTRSLQKPQHISIRLVGLKVLTPCGAVSTRQYFRNTPWLLELCRYGMISDLWMRTNPLQVRRDRGLGPRRNPRRALATEASAN